MEHRCSSRRLYSGEVWIDSSYRSLRVRVRDLSAGGIGVIAKSLALPLHAPVSIRFADDMGPGCGRPGIRGMVAWLATESAGIMFVESPEAFLASLPPRLPAPSLGTALPAVPARGFVAQA